MFNEDVAEQELYHATATVTILLVEMAEVGKLFCCPGTKDQDQEGNLELNQHVDLGDRATESTLSQGATPGGVFQQRDPTEPFLPGGLEQSEPRPCGAGNGDEAGEQLPPMQDIKLDDSSPKDTGTSSAMLISDDETKDDTSMSSYSVLSAGSHELDEKLQCEDIADDTVLVGSGNGPGSKKGNGPHVGGGLHDGGGLPHSTSIDKDWAITFEQFLASVLTEHALVQYFEKPVELEARITNAKNVRKVGRPLLSTSDYEISLSG